VLRIIIRELPQGALAQLLVQLGELPGHGGTSVRAGQARQILQQGAQTTGSLEEHDAPFFRGRTGEQPGTLAALSG
jgi:hypothetical protein